MKTPLIEKYCLPPFRINIYIYFDLLTNYSKKNYEIYNIGYPWGKNTILINV